MTKKFYGDRPTITGDRQVAALPTSKSAMAPIQIDKHFRNGKAPDPTVFSMLNEGMNQAAMFRTKEVFGAVGYLGTGAGLAVSSAGAGERIRWRGAFHTGPYTHALLARVVMYPPTSGYTSNTYGRLYVYSDTAEATEVTAARTDFYYGPSPTGSASASGWQYLKTIDKWIEGLDPDTDYYLKLVDVDNGLIQSVSIGDIHSLTENYDGYLPQNFTGESQILDEYRANLVAPIKPLWNRAGAKLFQWNAEPNTSPRTNATTNNVNIIDGSSTTYGASIPGFTLNLTGKARLSESSGTPVAFKAFISSTSAANGQVWLHDSSGTQIAKINFTGGGGTSGWYTGTDPGGGTIYLPASSSKYYITSNQTVGAATISTYAVCLYEHT